MFICSSYCSFPLASLRFKINFSQSTTSSAGPKSAVHSTAIACGGLPAVKFCLDTCILRLVYDKSTTNQLNEARPSTIPVTPMQHNDAKRQSRINQIRNSEKKKLNMLNTDYSRDSHTRCPRAKKCPPSLQKMPARL